MKPQPKRSKRYIFMGIIILSLGITFNTSMKDSFGLLGIVFIGLGGLFFIIGMNMKRKED